MGGFPLVYERVEGTGGHNGIIVLTCSSGVESVSDAPEKKSERTGS